MAPDPSEPPSEGVPTDANAHAIEPGELYVVIRKAVEDAILGVIGTLLLLGVAFVLLWFGIVLAFSAADSSPTGMLAGAFVAVVGIYVAASALGVVPAVTDVVRNRARR